MGQKRKRRSDLQHWYEANRKSYDNLAGVVADLLKRMLENAKIPFLSITFRTKTIESVLDKNRRKKYRSPEKEITDFAGVRVITYISSDASKVSELIKKYFSVDESKSLNKGSILASDQVGYHSFHYICSFSENRLSLPENSAYTGLVFEIQVRTVLQHAWAEIEHDRNYKFSGVLPDKLRRRLYLISGLLEIADREFDDLASDFDKYKSAVAVQAKTGPEDYELTTASFLANISRIQALFPKLKVVGHNKESAYADLLKECRAFGLATFGDLSRLATKDYIELISRHATSSVTVHGIVRDLMILTDYELYFEKAWQKEHWSWTEEDSLDLWLKVIPYENIRRKLREKKIDILNVEDDGSISPIPGFSEEPDYATGSDES
jgi:putative GTP pyrophosphokinase